MKTGNSTLGGPRRGTIASIVLFSLLTFCSAFLTAVRGNAAEPEGFVFMDLGSSVKALEQTVNTAGPAVVMVVSYDKSGAEIARGSGFFIDKDGRVITNAVVIKDAYSAEVISERKTYPYVAVIREVEHLDLALLKVEDDSVSFLNVNFEEEINPGDKVVITGKASERRRTVSEGSVSTVREINDGSGSVMEVQIAPSLSSLNPAKDGPLLNTAGDVIGLASSHIAELQGSNGIPLMRDSRTLTALTAGAMQPFLADSDAALYLKHAGSRVWTAWFGRQIKTFAISGFVVLYSIGFPKLLAIAFIVILAISLIQWVFTKIKRGDAR